MKQVHCLKLFLFINFIWIKRLKAHFNNIFKTKVYKWSQNAPEWRFVKAGLCFEGKCSNPDCKASNQMVIINMGVPVSLDIFGFDGSRPTNCPVCKKFVKPLTCAFNNCTWKHIGRRMTQNGSEIQKSDWANVGDEYFRFNESNQVEWASLVLETKRDTSTIPKQQLSRLDEEQIQVTKELKCQLCFDVKTDSQATECPCRKRSFLFSDEVQNQVTKEIKWNVYIRKRSVVSSHALKDMKMLVFR